MHLSIREWRINDKSALAENLNNPKVLNNLRDGLPYPYTEQDAEDFITAMLSANKNSTYAFAITLDDEVIGSIGVFRRDNIHYRTAEMGYYIGEPYWGNGYMTNIIKQVCEYIFENTEEIFLTAFPSVCSHTTTGITASTQVDIISASLNRSAGAQSSKT